MAEPIESAGWIVGSDGSKESC